MFKFGSNEIYMTLSEAVYVSENRYLRYTPRSSTGRVQGELERTSDGGGKSGRVADAKKTSMELSAATRDVPRSRRIEASVGNPFEMFSLRGRQCTAAQRASRWWMLYTDGEAEREPEEPEAAEAASAAWLCASLAGTHAGKEPRLRR